ncbi:MAG: MFS transporter [Candidatus Heimdallarchaeota archaeon]|nr:MFS transporter [Candidatus Heimdallarchaeota archaeon]
MLDIQKHNAAKYLLFSSLYFSEGIQLSITTVLIPIFLLEQGFTPAITSLAAGLIMIPWVLKFIFGYIVDANQKISKKYFTLYGGLVSAIGLILVGILINDMNIALLILLLFGAQCAITILDVSLDSWAINTTKKKERGSINGTMMAGFFTGIAFGSTTLTYIAEHYGYPSAFFTAAIIIITIMIIPYVTKKPDTKERKKPLPSIIKKEFSRPLVKKMSILLPFISINSGLLTLAVPIFMNKQLDLRVSQIGLIITVFTIGRIIGAISFGILSDHIDRQKTLWYIIVASIVSSFFLITATSWETLTVIYVIIGFLNGGLFSVLFALLMDMTNKNIGALQFAIFIGLLNAGELTGEILSGSLITLFGFGRVFLLSAWIFGPSLLLMYWIHQTQKNLT